MKNNDLQREYSYSSISEQDFFDSICDDELFVLMMYFQQERREAFKVYVQYLEFVAEASSIDAIEKLNKEKMKYWHKQAHYESLMQWCFEELNKRRNMPPA